MAARPAARPAPRRVVALGARAGGRRQPHHQPAPPAADRRRRGVRRVGPPHRRALGAWVPGLRVPRPPRDRDPGGVPSAARRPVRRPHPLHAAGDPAARCRGRASGSVARCRSRASSRPCTTGSASRRSCSASAPPTRSPTRSACCSPCRRRSTRWGWPSPSRSSVAPQLIESGQRVRRARRLRGEPGRRFHIVREVALPVMTDALDRSLLLAAAMDSRGYGRIAAARPVRAWPSRARCSLGGLVAVAHRHLRPARQHRAALPRAPDARRRGRPRLGRRDPQRPAGRAQPLPARPVADRGVGRRARRDRRGGGDGRGQHRWIPSSLHPSLQPLALARPAGAARRGGAARAPPRVDRAAHPAADAASVRPGR